MRLWLSLASLIVLLSGLLAYRQLPGTREALVLPLTTPTPCFHYQPRTPPRGRILVVHGLNSNKEIMNLLAYGLADSGFEVFSIDLPGHGDSPAGFDALLARQIVLEALEWAGEGTIGLGHSLGAGLLLDIAYSRPFERLVLLSPAPTDLDDLLADRVLVMSGQFDIPRIHAFVPFLEHAGAGAVDVRNPPWIGHTGLVFRASIIREIGEWLGGDTTGINTGWRLVLLLASLAGALGLGWSICHGGKLAGSPGSATNAVVAYAAAGVLAAGILWVVVPLAWLRLFATDYMISFVLVGGMFLVLWRPHVVLNRHSLLRVLAAAIYIIAVPGVLVGSEFVHLSLSGGRWWRFAVIAAAVLPMHLADELWLRRFEPWWKRTALAALTRLVTGALIVAAVQTISRDYAFLVLITHLVILFWMALWLAGEVIRRHSQDPLATATFCALVQAWVFAAVFVTV